MADNKPAQQQGPKSKADNKPTKTRQYTVSQAIRLTTQGKADLRRQVRVKKAQDEGRRRSLQRLDRSRLPLNSLGEQRCFPSTQIFGGDPVGGKRNSWICGELSQARFVEKSYDTRECAVRMFIEGAEVTPYIRGNLAWSIQTTGGMNTCTFTLNNNHDAFMLTPGNVCSGTQDLHGWRVPLDGKRRVITTPSRVTRNTDETAKYIIYRNKIARVKPGTPGQQIDDAGFWLYDLSPNQPIFDRHDCVRVFYRLPHVSHVVKYERQRVKAAREMWAPAFTGFIHEYDYEDDPVSGDRLMNIRCYDWRGLLDRMRVRTVGSRLAGSASKANIQGAAIFQEQREAAKSEESFGFSTKFLNIITQLRIAAELIALFNARFSADVRAAGCAQGSQNILECGQEVYNRIYNSIKTDVVELKTLFKDLDDSVKEANKTDGRNRKLVRPNDGDVQIETKQRGVADTLTAIRKAIKFLQSTGSIAESYAGDYATTYEVVFQERVNFLGTYNVTERTSNPTAGNNSIFKQANTDSRVKAIDEEINSKYSTIYVGAGLGKNPNVDRVYLINNFVYSTLVEFFSGVSQGIKDVIDRYVVRATSGTRPTTIGQPTATVGDRLFTPVTIKQFGTVVQSGLVTFTRAAVSGGVRKGRTSAAVILAFQDYMTGGQRNRARTDKASLTDKLQKFNAKLNEVKSKLRVAEDRAAQARENDANARTETRLEQFRRVFDRAHEDAKNNPTKQAEGIGPIADLIVTDARFNESSVGFFADLVKAVGRDPHPLSGMSYELAVEWLTLTRTPLSKGFEEKLSTYERDSLQKWNRTLVFGIIGRPMTYAEVTEMGVGTSSELDVKKAPYSPLHAFVHMLLPKEGTGASTIVQQDITHNPGAVKEYNYETRLALLNKISETLDYQFFVSPAGDLTFEFPNYNALPYDYGKLFMGAYTITRGLRNFKMAPETGDMPTAWVLTGSENDRFADNVTGDQITENKFKKVVLVANMLARRVGVFVKELKVSLPGVGAVIQGKKPLSSLIAYGLLELQRDIGRMRQASVGYEYRPYMLPNRPIHVVHRQCIALSRNVDYSMSPPLGAGEVQTDLHFIRTMHHDGSFRFITGGPRLPVDYSSLFTGDVKQTLRFGATPKTTPKEGEQQSAALRNSVLEMTGRRKPRRLTDWSCGPYLRDRWLEASVFYSDAIDASYRKADRYTAWTSGADGQSGTLPPLPRGGRNYIASRVYRPTEVKGAPDASVTTEKTGINNASDPNDRPTKAGNATYLGKLYNPWPYGIYSKRHHNKFNQWGFYRIISPSGKPEKANSGMFVSNKNRRYKFYRQHRGKIDGWHGGMDFNGVKLGTQAYTPITIYNVQAYMGVGWSSYQNSSGVYVPILGPADQSKLPKIFNLFGRRPNVKGRSLSTPIVSTPSQTSPELRVYQVDSRGLRLYNKFLSRNISVYVTPRISPKCGLTVQAWGYATMPGAQNQKVACRLQYIHCGDLVKNSQGKYLGDQNLRKKDRLVPADSPIAVVGNTGTNNVHLHLEMYIYPPGSEPSWLKGRGGTDQSAWKEMLKANEEFLRTQMQMKLTAGKGLNSQQLSDSWRRYFEAYNRRTGKGITTVDEATAFMLSKSERFEKYTNPRTGREVQTNPAFFFRPEQIIKDMADKYQDYRQSFGDKFFRRTSGNEERTQTGADICGGNRAALSQKIGLEYSTCLGKARKLRNAQDKRAARKKCRELRDRDRQQVVIRPRQLGDANERVDRRLQANVRSSIQTEAGDRMTRGAIRTS